jgi:Tol biopolymer transport system component
VLTHSPWGGIGPIVSLSQGTRLGTYEITGQLGAGGMGEVYQATDSALKREVAIKVLPQSLVSDAERVARLRREAELLASLNHPNLAQVFGLEEVDGSIALVMELIEGPTLSDRIAAGAIPADEALEIAMQIGDALQAAHGQAIVHRDLKPANIKLRPDGVVKVLDFGIAKALDEQTGTTGPRMPSLTRTSMTRAGLILGTAAYMSPEQARGRRVDQRTDIWAFGCILYEMLTGQPAFVGEDDTSTLAKVLERDTDLSRLPGAIQPQVRHALELCLRKNPADRVADIRDVQLALRGGLQVAGAGSASRPRLIAGLALTAVVAAAAGWLLKPGEPRVEDTQAPVVRASIDVAAGNRLIGRADNLDAGVGLQRPSRPAMAFSPDGRFLVYAAIEDQSRLLFRHSLESGRASAMPGTEGGLMPFFSPDGRSVGFFAGTDLKRVDIDSGDVRTIPVSGQSMPDGGTTASWTEDDTIVFGGDDGIYEVSATGGAPMRLTEVMDLGQQLHVYPQMLPARRALLYTEATLNLQPSEWRIVVQPLDGGDLIVVVDGGSHGQYLPTGHIVFARAGQLLTMPFAADSLTAGTTQAVVIEDVMYAERGGNGNLNTGTAQVAFSASGALAYVPGGIYPSLGGTMEWVDLSGARTEIALPEARYLMPRFSPGDGRYLAYVVGDFGNTDLWVYDRVLEIPTPLTQGLEVAWPVWSPDGSRIAVQRRDAGNQIYTIAADGSGEPEIVGDGIDGAPAAWSADNVLAYLHSPGPGEPTAIWTLRLDGNSEPEPFAATQASNPRFSPNGQLVAYDGPVDGRAEVFIRPFPEGPAQRISNTGGLAPIWSPDGARLYYKALDPDTREQALWEIDVNAEPPFVDSRARVLFQGRMGGTTPIDSYDIAPDGQRFVTITRSDDEQALQPVERVNIVLNWFDELERLVPTD